MYAVILFMMLSAEISVYGYVKLISIFQVRECNGSHGQ